MSIARVGIIPLRACNACLCLLGMRRKAAAATGGVVRAGDDGRSERSGDAGAGPGGMLGGTNPGYGDSAAGSGAGSSNQDGAGEPSGGGGRGTGAQDGGPDQFTLDLVAAYRAGHKREDVIRYAYARLQERGEEDDSESESEAEEEEEVVEGPDQFTLDLVEGFRKGLRGADVTRYAYAQAQLREAEEDAMEEDEANEDVSERRTTCLC